MKAMAIPKLKLQAAKDIYEALIIPINNVYLPYIELFFM